MIRLCNNKFQKDSHIRAILLSAGFGTRLKPISDIIPKCLLPINGRPLIEYWIGALYEAGIEDVLMNLHYLAMEMEKWIDQSAFAGRVCTVYENQILGTGGTLLQNSDFVGNEPVMLIHADNLCLADLSSFIKAHENRPSGTELTMMTFTAPAPETCGIVEIDRKGVVQAFYEKVDKPPGNLANAAVYILEPTIIGFLEELKKNFIDFSTEVLPYFIGKIHTFHNAVYHRDIGTVESFLTAQWECRFAMSCPRDRNDSWRKYCEENEGAFGNKFLDCLAKALCMEVIDLTNQNNFGAVPNDGEAGDKSKKIFKLSTEADLPPLIGHLEKSEMPLENQIVFLPKADAGFSSKRILDEGNLKTIALCASAVK